MSENKSISLRIGAELSSGFKQSFEGASHRLTRLNGDVKDFKKQIKGLGELKKLEEKTKSAGKAWLEANQALSSHKKKLIGLGSATTAQAKKLDTLVQKSKKARESYVKQKTAIAQLRQGLSQAGINTRELTKENERLERSMKSVTARADHLNSAMKRIKDNRDHRAELRGGIMETVATTAATAFPIVKAAQAQASSDRLNSVLSLGQVDPKAALLAKQASINAARQGVTSFAEANDIQYAFNSAELGNLAARQAIIPVAKSAYLMGSDNKTVANDVAGAYNNFYKNKVNTSDPKAVQGAIKEITNLFTAAQIKYHHEDFTALNEMLKYAAGAMQVQGVGLAQILGVDGIMANGRVAESTQGAALRALLMQTSIKGQQYMVRDDKGNMDVIGTLKSLNRNLSPNKDERIQQLSEIYGQEMASPIAQTLTGLKDGADDLKDMLAHKDGIVDRKYGEMAKHTELKWTKLKRNLGLLSMSLGGPMLDAVNAVITPLTYLAQMVSKAADTFPTLTRVVFGSIAALATFKVLKLGGGYLGSLIGQVANYGRLGSAYLGAGGRENRSLKKGGWFSKLRPKWFDKFGKTKLGKLGGKTLGGLGKAGSLISAATATPVYVTNFSELGGGGTGSMLGDLVELDKKKGRPGKFNRYLRKKFGRFGGVFNKLEGAGKFLGKFGKLPGMLAVLGTGVDVLSTVADDNLSRKKKVKRIAGDVGGLSGTAMGAVVGGAIGSVIPVFGTMLGSIAGSVIGGWLGNKAGKSAADLFDPKEHVREIAQHQINNQQEHKNVQIHNNINQTINANEGQKAKDIAKESVDKMMKPRYGMNPYYDGLLLGGGL